MVLNRTQRRTDEHKRTQAKKFANGVRTRVLEYIIQNNGGYMSQACSSAEIFACLLAHNEP